VTGEQVEAAAQAAGNWLCCRPVTHGGFAPCRSMAWMPRLRRRGEGKLLAYCRSGTRLDPALGAEPRPAGEDCDALRKRRRSGL